MRLFLNGDINVYYIQTLCMIFFPGAKFGSDAQNDPDAPALYLNLEPHEEGLRAAVTVMADGKSASCEKYHPFTEGFTRDKTAKMVCGAAVISACGELMGYRPSWGMLTGVRPSKVATELLQSGMSKTRGKQASFSHGSCFRLSRHSQKGGARHRRGTQRATPHREPLTQGLQYLYLDPVLSQPLLLLLLRFLYLSQASQPDPRVFGAFGKGF